MKNTSSAIIFKYFVAWRVTLFIVAFVAIILVPLFGGRFPYSDTALQVTGLPAWIWGFGNFDGVHYLRIAQNLYSDAFVQAFFPLYPLLIRIFSVILPRNPVLDPQVFVDPSYFYSGLILSNTFFLLALFALYKLIRIDFDNKTTVKSIVLLLVFPTSFYFGAIYAESLFLLLAILSIYFVRKEKYKLSGVFIALASLTKVFGIILVLIYLVEALKGKLSFPKLLGAIIAPLGILAYMYYLYISFGDPFHFVNSQYAFGAERLADGIVLLPQVLYRYIMMLISLPPVSLSYLNVVTELAFTLIPLAFLVIVYKKMHFSYWLFSVIALLIPTLTGTLSSMPRYALIAFLALPLIAVTGKKYYKPIVVIFGLLQVLLLSLFIRGYWVA